MTKAELEKEAEESFEQYKVTDEDYVVSPYSDDMGEKMLRYKDEDYAEETYLRLYTEGYIAGATEATKELEKENTELKEALKNDKVCKCSHYLNFKDLENQLTEAKEIIREYYNLKNFPCASGNSINMLMYENINHKAEAFLKE